MTSATSFLSQWSKAIYVRSSSCSEELLQMALTTRGSPLIGRPKPLNAPRVLVSARKCATKRACFCSYIDNKHVPHLGQLRLAGTVFHRKLIVVGCSVCLSVGYEISRRPRDGHNLHPSVINQMYFSKKRRLTSHYYYCRKYYGHDFVFVLHTCLLEIHLTR